MINCVQYSGTYHPPNQIAHFHFYSSEGNKYSEAMESLQKNVILSIGYFILFDRKHK